MQVNWAQGIDLKIDPSIRIMCDASNKTANSTRSVLYLLVVATVLSLIAVINSSTDNWSALRMQFYESEISRYEVKLREAGNDTSIQSVFLKDSLEQAWKNWDIQSSIDANNFNTVRVPILGNAFDIDDLSTVAGVTIIILLFIFRFSILREMANLRLALDAVTRRYTHNADMDAFEKYLQAARDGTGDENSGHAQAALAAINLARREYHYNTLAMSEVFNLPPLRILKHHKKRYGRRGGLDKTVVLIPWFPCLIYLVIVANDVVTFKYGFEISPVHTTLSTGFALICLAGILMLSISSARLKATLHKLYKSFEEHDYIYQDI